MRRGLGARAVAWWSWTMDKLLRVREVAELLGVAVRSVWRLAASGDIPPAVKLGGSCRWRASDLARFIECGCKRPDRVEVTDGTG